MCEWAICSRESAVLWNRRIHTAHTALHDEVCSREKQWDKQKTDKELECNNNSWMMITHILAWGKGSYHHLLLFIALHYRSPSFACNTHTRAQPTQLLVLFHAGRFWLWQCFCCWAISPYGLRKKSDNNIYICENMNMFGLYKYILQLLNTPVSESTESEENTKLHNRKATRTHKSSNMWFKVNQTHTHTSHIRRSRTRVGSVIFFCCFDERENDAMKLKLKKISRDHQFHSMNDDDKWN